MHCFQDKGRIGKAVICLDEQPLLLRAFHADKDKETVQFFAMQDKFDPPGTNAAAHEIIRSMVPDEHESGTIMIFRNAPFKCGIRKRMVLNMNCKTLVMRVHGRSFRHCPRCKNAIHFEANIEMEVAGVMLVHDKNRHDSALGILVSSLAASGWRPGSHFRGHVALVHFSTKAEADFAKQSGQQALFTQVILLRKTDGEKAVVRGLTGAADFTCIFHTESINQTEGLRQGQ